MKFAVIGRAGNGDARPNFKNGTQPSGRATTRATMDAGYAPSDWADHTPSDWLVGPSLDGNSHNWAVERAAIRTPHHIRHGKEEL